MVGCKSTLTVTASLLGLQSGLEIVHCKVTDEPGVNPLMLVVAELGLAIVAVPEITVQIPVPTDGIFPMRVAVVTPQTI